MQTILLTFTGPAIRIIYLYDQIPYPILYFYIYLLFLTSLLFIPLGNTLIYDIHFLFIHYINYWKRGRSSTFQNV
jgi:hypothetical protein